MIPIWGYSISRSETVLDGLSVTVSRRNWQARKTGSLEDAGEISSFQVGARVFWGRSFFWNPRELEGGIWQVGQLMQTIDKSGLRNDSHDRFSMTARNTVT